MRRNTFTLGFLAALITAVQFTQAAPASPTIDECTNAALLSSHDNDVDTSDRYIVMLKPGIDLSGHLNHIYSDSSEASVKSNNNEAFKGVTHEFELPSIRAYAGHFDRDTVEQLKGSDDVAGVEKDQVWSIHDFKLEGAPYSDHLKPQIEFSTRHQDTSQSAFATQTDSPWYLRSISHRKTEKETEGYVYQHNPGKGTYAYVIDSGITLTHQEFQGRASKGYDAVKKGPFKDTYGSGTHAAAIIGGSMYGVAKECSLIDVKVFSGRFGRLSTIIDGYMWAVSDIIKQKRQAKSVIHISIGGGNSDLFDKAVQTASQMGITTVVPAGFSRCPARKPESAIIVGATDQSRTRYALSSHGPKVTVFAPGVSIASAWYKSDNLYANLTGTSAASPQVAGVVLYMKSLQILLNAQATKSKIENLATRNVVKDALGSPNRFLYNGSGK